MLVEKWFDVKMGRMRSTCYLLVFSYVALSVR